MKTTRKTTMSAAALAATLGALTFAACGERAPTLETRTYRIEHLRPAAAEALITPYVYTDREEAPGTSSRTTGAISVRETPDNLEKIERVLAEFDVPSARQASSDLLLRFQLIEADGYDEPADASIREVVTELERLFRFKGYRLMGEAVIRGGNEAALQQRFQGAAYSVSAQSFTPEPGVLTLRGLRLWPDDSPPVMETSVTLTAGQTVVLGSAPSPSSDGAVILTVKAEDPTAGDL